MIPGNNLRDNSFMSPVYGAQVVELETKIAEQQARIDAFEALIEEFERLRAKEYEVKQARIDELEADVKFYKHRCDELQEIQMRMRDPERQMVCDILANGLPRDKAGIGKYLEEEDELA